MMTSPNGTNFDRDSLVAFSRHARTGLTMTIVGAAIVVGSVVYTGRQLQIVQRERAALTSELDAARKELKTLSASRDAAIAGRDGAKKELAEVQQGVQDARASFQYLQLGLRQFFVKDYAGAIRFYDQAIQVDAANPVLYDLKGYALLRQGNGAQAIATLKHATQIAPEYVWGHYNLALAYGKAGRLDEAIEEVRKVLRIDPAMKETIRGDGQFRILRNQPAYRALLGDG